MKNRAMNLWCRCNWLSQQIAAGLALAVAVLLSAPGLSWSGSVFLTGHDPDFHATRGGNTAGAQNLNAVAIDFVRDPVFNAFASAGSRFLFVESNISPPSGHTIGKPGIVASGYAEGVDFDHHDASTLDAALSELGSTYDAIVVASDFGGLLTQAELDILNAHSAEIIDFLNAGGGLYAMAESNNGSGLTPGGGQFGFLPFVVASTPQNQVETGFTVTPFGASLGLVDADVNGNASHNVFEGSFGLEIVDVDASGRILSLAARGEVTACGIDCLVLEPTVSVNPPGSDHSVTASLVDSLGMPAAGVVMDFAVTSGPNAGASGTCSPNADCTTDAGGEAAFSYASSGAVGVDAITVSFFDDRLGQVTSQPALKFWDADCQANAVPDTCDLDCAGFGGACGLFDLCGVSADADGDSVPDGCNAAPICSEARAEPAVIRPSLLGLGFAKVTLRGAADPDGDPVAISIDAISQDEPVKRHRWDRRAPDAFPLEGPEALLRAERDRHGNGRVYHIGFTAADPSGATCSGRVQVCVPRHKWHSERCGDEGPLFDSTVVP